LPRLCGFSFAGHSGQRQENRPCPLFEFHLPLEFLPASPSRSAAADWLLSWTFAPFSTFEERRSTSHGLSRSRYVPPSGFGYPLDGLRPPSPGRLCFAPAALMGFTLRSFSLSKGIRSVSARKDPPAVSPAGMPARLRRQAGPAGRGFWALPLSRVPCDRALRLASRPRDAPLGFAPSRACPQEPWRRSLSASSHALHTLARERGEYRRLRVSIGSRFTSPALKDRPPAWREVALLGFSHRPGPVHPGVSPPGLCVHLVLRRTLLPTDQHSLRGSNALPELFRIG
jgi:hypothetical protein